MSPKMTVKQRTIRYLEAQGFRKDDSRPRTTKYDKYKAADKEKWYFLGPCGAVLLSFHGTVSTAVSVTDYIQRDMRAWEAGKPVRGA